VAERIEFRGYVPRAELLDLYAACTAVAVPSRYEGFGYAAAQALCAGTPVVVSDRASLPEVAGESAVIAAADEERQWIDAIARIMSDPGSANRHAEMQRDRSIARFAWAAGARKMIEVYSGVLGHSRS
jgi:glycosyltransferase involved in cell wall biosynthesis